MIIDSHQHFLEPARIEYPWLTSDLAAIRRRFAPEDLAALLAGSGIDRTIAVQAHASLEETRELLALSAANAFIAGVVGWVDLTDDAVATTLQDLNASPNGGRLVGIRHPVHDEPDPAWLLRADVQRGLKAVQEQELTYDLLVRPRELAAAHEIARRHPELRFVVDHLGKPRIQSGGDPAWAERMKLFIPLDNVAFKLSGLVTEAEWNRWTVAELAPYVERALTWFGADRLLFGSDWPVCLLAAPYPRVFDAYSESLGNIPNTARELIFGLNAIRIYRLET